MSGESGGTPQPTLGPSVLRVVIDQALLSSRLPESIDTSVSGGVVVNARLAALIEEGLHGLYGVTGGRLSEEEWLAAGLGVPLAQVAAAGPAALARLLSESSQEPEPEFWPQSMTAEEDRQDAADSAEAADLFSYPRVQPNPL